MGPFLIPLLVLQLFYSTTLSKIFNAPIKDVNSISDKLNDYSVIMRPDITSDHNDIADDEDDFADLLDLNDEDVPLVQTFEDKTELKFRQPIESVNIDYSRNAVVLKFNKNYAKSMMKFNSVENGKKKSVQDNFIRFGKRSYEEYPLTNSLDMDSVDTSHGMRSERSHQTARDARGDNFMRFGRSGNVKNDFMRFGRGGDDFMRFGRSPSQDFMRFGRSVGQDFMRFGRAAGQDFMRFGRAPGQDFMRFGRTPSQDFMRFGRSPSQDFMRFGRNTNQDLTRPSRAGQDNFMRFGRNPHENFMRFGKSTIKMPLNKNFMRSSRPDNFMRFGRARPHSSDNFMRFGKSLEKSSDKNVSQPLMGKNELKEAVKLIHEADKNADNENPVDKAIKVLFDKHQQQDSKDNSAELSDDSNSLNSDMDYFLKVTE